MNVVLSLVPTPLTAAMITEAMPAAISAYSMAVAPELSFKKRSTSLFMGRFQCWPVPFYATIKQPDFDSDIESDTCVRLPGIDVAAIHYPKNHAARGHDASGEQDVKVKVRL